MKCSNAEKFRTELYNLINNCKLPLATAFYIVKDVYRDFNETYLKIIQQEQLFPSENEEGVIVEYSMNSTEKTEEEKENG